MEGDFRVVQGSHIGTVEIDCPVVFFAYANWPAEANQILLTGLSAKKSIVLRIKEFWMSRHVL